MSKTLYVLLCLLPLLASVAQETLDRVLVVVDEEIILESEVTQELQRYLMEHSQDPDRMSVEELEEIKLELVQGMIDARVMLATARADTNIVVQERDVERATDERIDAIARQVGGTTRLEELMGQPVRKIRAELLQDMRDQFYIEQLQQRYLGEVSVTRQEIEDFFESFQDSLPRVGESVHLQDIFLEFKASPESDRRAYALADSVRQLLVADPPADFAEMARIFSQDQGSAEYGGSIGRTKRGTLVRAYEETAYRMNDGEISAPVRSDYGWHVIRLDDRAGEYIETSHILFSLQPTAQDEQYVVSLADSLYALLEEGAAFDSLAMRYTNHELSRQSGGDLGWIEFDKLVPLVRSRVRDLAEGDVLAPMRGEMEGKQGLHIYRKIEQRPSRRPDLEDDWEQISQMARNWKKNRQLDQYVSELRSQVYYKIVD